MSNPLFSGQGNNVNPGNTIGNVMQIFSRLKQNPLEVLRMAGFNIPSGMNLNDPGSILSYLMQSKQVNQNMVNQAQQMSQMPQVAQMLMR